MYVLIIIIIIRYYYYILQYYYDCYCENIEVMDLMSGDLSPRRGVSQKCTFLRERNAPEPLARALRARDWLQPTESDSWILIGQSEVLLTLGCRQSARVSQPSQAFDTECEVAI